MIAPQKRGPAMNGAGTANRPHASYTACSRRTIADCLNPRRRTHCERLLSYVAWHGRKVYLDRDRYADIRAECRLDAYQVDAAADDLYALGCIDIAQWGERTVLTLLDDDIDRLAGQGVRR